MNLPTFQRLLPALLLVLAHTACRAQVAAPPGREIAPGVREIGRISSARITESSGVVASRQHAGVLWTQTDGGGPKKQWLSAMTRDGAVLKEYFISDATIADWEDIATDDAKHLYIADTGNNDLRRAELAVHQLAEPDPRGDTVPVRITRSWRLKFPGGPFDCESLFIWKGHGYVVSKVFKDARAQIFRFPLDGPTTTTLELVATTKIESPVTGADVSADGRLLGLVAKSGAFLYVIDGDMSRVIKAKPFQVKFRHEQIEACTFVPEGLLATAESREILLFTDPKFRGE